MSAFAYGGDHGQKWDEGAWKARIFALVWNDEGLAWPEAS